jgi:hypothetical protein
MGKMKSTPNGEPASRLRKAEHEAEVLMSWQRGEIITTVQATRLVKAFQSKDGLSTSPLIVSSISN